MAYVKTNWVDNVTEANATTMNNIENGIYNLDKKRNYIQTKKTNETISFNSGYTKIKQTIVMSNIGSNLNLTNNNIVIGQGISKVKITASLALYNANGSIGLAIRKNDQDTNLTLSWGITQTGKDITILSMPIYIGVNQNDTIQMYLYTGTNQTFNVQGDTSLIVEAID